MKKYALALATVAPLALAGTANAKDVGGKFGLGGQVDLGGLLGNLSSSAPTAPAGLSLRYWISDLGLEANFGLAIKGETQEGADNGTTALGLGFHLLYNFARANDTNMYAGLGVNLGLIDAETTVIAARLGVEHFFTDHFSVGGHVGLSVDLGDQFKFSLGETASWGSSFHFYF
jgi:hypothetical protein